MKKIPVVFIQLEKGLSKLFFKDGLKIDFHKIKNDQRYECALR